jgi:TM2 domain-containing membrane protein YozV
MEALPSPTTSQLDGTDLVAIVLSVLAPGLGHVILGQVAKGLVIMALVIASCGVGYIVSAIVALDAFSVAKARRRRTVGLWETFPE